LGAPDQHMLSFYTLSLQYRENAVQLVIVGLRFMRQNSSIGLKVLVHMQVTNKNNPWNMQTQKPDDHIKIYLILEFRKEKSLHDLVRLPIFINSKALTIQMKRLKYKGGAPIFITMCWKRKFPKIAKKGFTKSRQLYLITF
jgi:hypothetical protein